MTGIHIYQCNAQQYKRVMANRAHYHVCLVKITELNEKK